MLKVKRLNKTSMKNIKNYLLNQKGFAPIVIILIIVGVLAIGAGIWFWQNQKALVPETPETPKPPVEEFKLDLDIVTLKDTYVVGEEFSGGKYLLSYTGDPFRGIILYGKSRKGFEKTGYDKIGGKIKTGDFDSNLSILRVALMAFKMDKFGYEAGEESFQEAGEYIFTMSVYKCADIGLEDEKCSVSVPTDFILKFKPLGSVSKTILVVEKTETKPEAESAPSKIAVLDCDFFRDTDCPAKALSFFEENLKLCKPSKGITGVGWEPIILQIFRNYEIFGTENNLCVVNFSVIKAPGAPSSPVDTLLNKKMVCKYSATERTMEKVVEGKNCTGPLYDEMMKILEQLEL